MKRQFRGLVCVTALLAVSAGANAAVITSSLGNTSSGFSDGDKPTAVQISGVQSGQAAPFDQVQGSDLLANATGTWTHNYAAIVDPIASASISLGLVDHDSAASGDQVALFTVDGNDFTVALNTLLNGHGGTDGEYNVYTVDLSSIAASLLDGTANVVLNLQGSGLQTCLVILPGCDPNNPVSPTSFNGANYIFSTLSITTRDVTPPPTVPEPATLTLLGLGLGALGFGRRRRSR